jgi:uncharacterized damage-inducible protein DinB
MQLMRGGYHLKSHIIRIFEHVTWADIQILNALQLIEDKPEKSIHLFTHVLSAEKVWLTRLNEKDSSQIQIWPNPGLEECERLVKENSEGYQIFLDQLTDHDLSRHISYRNTSGVEFKTTIFDILTHVSLHGSYHRGQISSYLRSEGYDPINTDYINFVRLKP